MTDIQRKNLVKSYLGKTVTIRIDRSIGYVHRKESYSLTYPINYGYIPGVIGGDGEELDVYLLGVNEPVSEYTARVIAIAYRHNDVEDKLVAAPENITFNQEEIRNAVNFQEQYYDTEFEVLSDVETINQYADTYSDPPERERAAGRGIVVRDGRILLSHELNTGVYMTPGGGIEKGETLAECCRREVREESGYEVNPLYQFLIINEYSFETKYVSNYFVCEVIGEGEQTLTDIEIEHGIVPEWVTIEDALAIFGTYNTKAPDVRSLYIRELTTINKYLELYQK